MEITNSKKIFFLAVNTGYTKNGVPDRRFLDFYSDRSGKGLHCAIVGNVAIPDGFGTNSSTPRIENRKIWLALAEAISSKGSLPGIQLSTTWENYAGAKKFLTNSPAEQLDHYRHTASKFDQNQIKSQFLSLKKATDIAINSGFKHIQLHAAHGYFFNLILDNRFSKHNDLAIDLTQDWLESIRSSKIETSIRISTLTGADEFDKENSSFLEKLTEIPFNFHDLSEGFYNINKRLIYPSIENILAERINRNINIALKHPHRNFISSGKSHALTQNDLPNNIHIGICRDIIANANFLQDKNNGCKNRMKCHYYSRGSSAITCGTWNKNSTTDI
jgi:NADPH2 dehydrogenase